MEINLVYNKIIEKLETLHYHSVVEDLQVVVEGAATGSEALTASGSYLSNLKNNDPLAYMSINELINDYLRYCKSNGLIIK